MKLANRHRLMTLAVMATIAILAARLFWIASHTQTGWQVVAEDTRAAAFGQFFGYRIPFKYRGQKAQQQVLVEEAKRILAHQPHSAELLAGAQSLLRWDFASDFNMEFTPESVTYFAQRYPLVEQLWEEDELARARLRIELADEAAARFRGERSAWQAKAIERSSRDSPLDADETSANHWRRVFDD